MFDQEKLERIFGGAIRVLSEMGLRVQNRRCLEILEKFSAKIDYPKMRAIMPEDCINRMQVIYEKLTRSVGLGLYGNLSGVEGTLDQGKVFSNTQLMLDHEMYRFFAWYTAEPAADEEELAVEEIIEIEWSSPGYIVSEHTMSRMKEVWESSIYTQDPEDEKRLLARAREMWKENLKKYEPPNHSEDFLRDLRRICDRAKKELR